MRYGRCDRSAVINLLIDVDGLGEADVPWTLGANSQYPARNCGPLAATDQR